ncbi:MAG: glycine oxidase ThiO [Synechococcus sp.]
MPKWDAIVVGSGAIGMAIAYELSLGGCKVALVDRGELGKQASWAAAGMLAPRAEELQEGPLLQLCLKSLGLYPEWSTQLQRLSGVDIGYWPCGILRPCLEGETVATDRLLTRSELDELQVGLGSKVVGAGWLPNEGQVDNRQLVQSLRAALTEVGAIAIPNTDVRQWQVEGDRVVAVQTSRGRLLADSFVLAGGAYSSELLDIPVRPLKGQMLMVNDPVCQLQHVLYGQGIYIVPRQDGRIVVGATEEDVGFEDGNTGGAMQSLLQKAIAVFPKIAGLNLLETWWGYRPTTPDLLPILGRGPQENVYVATGHHRNGILLVPATARVMARLILDGDRDPLLQHFSWRRFQAAELSKV